MDTELENFLNSLNEAELRAAFGNWNNRQALLR